MYINVVYIRNSQSKHSQQSCLRKERFTKSNVNMQDREESLQLTDHQPFAISQQEHRGRPII